MRQFDLPEVDCAVDSGWRWVDQAEMRRAGRHACNARSVLQKATVLFCSVLFL